MNKKEMLAFAKEAAKNMKTEKDLSDFSRMLKKSLSRLRLVLNSVITSATIETNPIPVLTAATGTPQKRFILTTVLSILRFHVIATVHSSHNLLKNSKLDYQAWMREFSSSMLKA
jgi:hypothetical protein